MHKFYRLDIMVAYSCNISCAGCISISDIKRSGIEPLDRLVNSINKWKTVIDPGIVTVFGGEPCLHPNLLEICATIRSSWPTAVIRLITNGYLLDNFDSSVWFDFVPFEMQVSVHRKDHEAIINQKIKNILQHRTPWTVVKQGGVREHRQMTWSHKQFSVYKSIFKDFITPYKKVSTQFFPWYSDSVQAHKICGSPATPILYKGLLYKCPPVANIMDITGENWFDYRAVDVHDDLDNFVNSIGKPESVCSQCPNSAQAVVVDHFNQENVVVRSKNIS
jgi:hypothetical protein